MIDLDHFRARLLARKQELEAQGQTNADSRDTVSLDQQSVGRVSRVDALQQQAMAQAGERRRLNELQRVEAALKRIDEDEYGYCLKCGEEVAVKRLEVDPAVTLCINCAG